MKVLNTKYKIELKEAISELESGKIITIPTDTFYGLACDATNGEVINNLFELKERGKDKPVPLLIADSEDLYKYNPQVDGIGKLISKFWPGPLTLILETDYMNNIKKKIEVNKLESSFFDMKLYTSKIEKAYNICFSKQMYTTYTKSVSRSF